jgi:hypothetical protein
MREPPGEPSTMDKEPSRSTMVGVMLLSIRFPGAMALASPPVSPKRFW